VNENVVGFCGFNVFVSVQVMESVVNTANKEQLILSRLYIVGAQRTDTRNMVTLHYLGFILLEN
jgi:hypothetical protein